MTTHHGITYKGGYKYQLKKDYRHNGVIFPACNFHSFLVIRDQALIIQAGYAWDGPSGPSFDTDNFMRASLVHDALYQLIREGWLSKTDRKACDQILFDICIADGMTWFRAKWVYHAVRTFGGKAAQNRGIS